MSPNTDLLTDEAIKRARIGVNRSPFFEWLMELHDNLVTAVLPIEWKGICARAAEMGKVDGSGKPPTPGRATKTWTAVRRVKAADAASKLNRETREQLPDLRPDQEEPAAQPAIDFQHDVIEQKEFTAPVTKTPAAVAPKPRRIASLAKEALPISATKIIGPTADQPAEGKLGSSVANSGNEKMDRILAELRKRSNENNGMF